MRIEKERLLRAARCRHRNAGHHQAPVFLDLRLALTLLVVLKKLLGGEDGEAENRKRLAAVFLGRQHVEHFAMRRWSVWDRPFHGKAFEQVDLGGGPDD